MGKRTSHPPGAFSYAELSTSDADAAKGFYGRILGWEFQDVPVGEAMTYHPAFRDGERVAALYAADEPPHWNNYVTVEDVEDVARRAGELGGEVAMEPMDVMGMGRSAALRDPTGAMLFLWEPQTNIGADLVNQPGAMAWNDLVTPDPEAAERFYGELLGWRFQEIPGSEGYRTIYNGERMNGGVFPLDDGPPAWMPYFGHEDVDGLLDGELQSLGAHVYRGPIQVPSGRFVVLADPQGAVFALLTAQYDD